MQCGDLIPNAKRVDHAQTFEPPYAAVKSFAHSDFPALLRQRSEQYLICGHKPLDAHFFLF